MARQDTRPSNITVIHSDGTTEVVAPNGQPIEEAAADAAPVAEATSKGKGKAEKTYHDVTVTIDGKTVIVPMPDTDNNQSWLFMEVEESTKALCIAKAALAGYELKEGEAPTLNAEGPTKLTVEQATRAGVIRWSRQQLLPAVGQTESDIREAWRGSARIPKVVTPKVETPQEKAAKSAVKGLTARYQAADAAGRKAMLDGLRAIGLGEDTLALFESLPVTEA